MPLVCVTFTFNFGSGRAAQEVLSAELSLVPCSRPVSAIKHDEVLGDLFGSLDCCRLIWRKNMISTRTACTTIRKTARPRVTVHGRFLGSAVLGRSRRKTAGCRAALGS